MPAAINEGNMLDFSFDLTDLNGMYSDDLQLDWLA
jgi:hypothetical protein